MVVSCKRPCTCFFNCSSRVLTVVIFPSMTTWSAITLNALPIIVAMTAFFSLQYSNHSCYAQCGLKTIVQEPHTDCVVCPGPHPCRLQQVVLCKYQSLTEHICVFCFHGPGLYALTGKADIPTHITIHCRSRPDSFGFLWGCRPVYRSHKRINVPTIQDFFAQIIN